MGKKKTKQLKRHTELSALGLLEHFKVVLEEKQKRVTFIHYAKVKRLLKPVDKLIEYFNNAENKARIDGGEPSEYLKWHEVHEQGQILWKELMSAAISHIDSTAKGNSTLYDYVDDAIKFEDLLYGLEEFYRDHTLHSLWVYLIGVKLMGEDDQLGKIGRDLDWYLFNDVKEGESPDLLVAWAKLYEKYINSKVSGKRDAIWCIMALCHDLGYSLAKLRKLNEHVENVLKHYHVSALQRVGYSLDIEHQYLVKQFLELMAMEVRITPKVDGSSLRVISQDRNGQTEELVTVRRWIERTRSMNDFKGDESLYDRFRDSINSHKMQDIKTEKSVDLVRQLNSSALAKCYRDDSLYWRLCKSLECKEHGILSAYLIYKTLGIFANAYIRGSAEEWGLVNGEEIYNIIRGNILFGIAQHEFAFAHITNISSLAEILILCDELEEFSRLGHQLQSRDYRPTTAHTRVQIASDDQNPGWVTIHMEYKSVHPSPEDFAKFWVRKAERLCQLFSLPPLKKMEFEEEEERGNNLIRGIKAKFIYTGKYYSRYNQSEFVMERDRGCYLEISGRNRKHNQYTLDSRDDKLHLMRGQKQPPLDYKLLLELLLKPRTKKVLGSKS